MRLPFFPAGAGDTADGKISTAWLITFTDLIGLLLAFFIMLFAMSSPDEEQWAKLAKLFAGELTIGDGTAEAEVPPQEVPSSTIVPAPARGLDTSYLASVLLAQLATEPMLARARIEPGPDHVALSLDAGLLLEDGAVTAEGRARIAAVRAMIAALPNAASVELYAAGRPQQPAAWSEAVARAAAVAAALEAAGYARPLAVRAHVEPATGDGRSAAGRIAFVISQ
jgi:chemotaxis protein MotB